jgi:hypothetical protein
MDMGPQVTPGILILIGGEHPAQSPQGLQDGTRSEQRDPDAASEARRARALGLHLMGLDERVYRCDSCGLVLRRDQNAAENTGQVAASEPET